MREVADELEAWLRSGETVAIATVVGVRGSAPRPLGATLVAARGGRLAGSVSNGCVEADVHEEAMAALADGRPRVVHYGISDELAFSVGLSCGGAIDVLVEPFGPLHERALAAVRSDRGVVLARTLAPAERSGAVAVLEEEGWSVAPPADLAGIERPARDALRDGTSREVGVRLADGRDAHVFLEALPRAATLVIIGATHVGVALSRMAKDVGWRVVVADPRPALASRERFPGADDIVLAWPDDALARLRIDERTAIVLLSHDPKLDRPGLAAALRSRARYIGAIGSRRTNEQRLAWLRADGFPSDDLERLRAPIGLDIGARTAEETALAILAEVVAVARGRTGASLSARALVAARAAER